MHTTLANPRQIERAVAGQATQDGDGVRLTRLLTADLQQRLDPFLMLDRFGTDSPGDYAGGFPEHPHRGFETITLMIQGRMRHRDSHGNVGLLEPGSVQWMTAGRGVIHSEMPEQRDGAMEGFQLWLNLPARDKLREPWYRDITAAEMPLREGPGYRARVVAGHSGGVEGAVQREGSEPLLLDLDLAPGAVFEQALPATHNAFVVAYRGHLEVAGDAVPNGALAILRNEPASDGVRLQAGPEGARAILVAGRPLGEPIAQHGPFVMNTRQQLLEAVEDFRAGRLG